MAAVRRSKSECPLCRQAIPPATELVINHKLRDLVLLASALHTVDQDGWEAVTSNNALAKSRTLTADSEKTDVPLVPTAPPLYMYPQALYFKAEETCFLWSHPCGCLTAMLRPVEAASSHSCASCTQSSPF